MSFVTVAFSSELHHNLLHSPCVHDPLNELIVVDNRENLFFDTLSAAWQSGIERATRALIVLVHEDVLLLPPWQAAMEAALDALEEEDPGWGLVGVAGWDDQGAMAGHWSDPSGCFDMMEARANRRVVRIDEHLMVFRRDSGLVLDTALPSIHRIGSDLSLRQRARGHATYVVNAPTVHKAADAEGRPILSIADSPKIQARASLTYSADSSCSDDYIVRKWGNAADDSHMKTAAVTSAEAGDRAPVILLARGGGGSRLLSLAAQDCGLSLGTEISASGDTLELVHPIYKLVLARFRYRQANLERSYRHEFIAAIRAMRQRACNVEPWGFKLPEAMLIPDLLRELFPEARFVHLLRDPLTTCLRRTHMTARSDNQVGQATLLAAYRAIGLGPEAILSDSPAMRMARTTEHQITGVKRALRDLPPERCLEIRFERLLEEPGAEVARLAAWLRSATMGPGEAPSAERLRREIAPERAAHPQVRYPPEIEAAVAAELQPLRIELGYGTG